MPRKSSLPLLVNVDFLPPNCLLILHCSHGYPTVLLCLDNISVSAFHVLSSPNKTTPLNTARTRASTRVVYIRKWRRRIPCGGAGNFLWPCMTRCGKRELQVAACNAVCWSHSSVMPSGDTSSLAEIWRHLGSVPKWRPRARKWWRASQRNNFRECMGLARSGKGYYRCATIRYNSIHL